MTETKSRFSNKTRRKPPSITICLENGNVILTTPSRSGIYSDVSIGASTSQHVSPVQDLSYMGSHVESPQSISPNSTLRDNEYLRKAATYQMPRNEGTPAELPGTPVELPGSSWFHSDVAPSDLELPIPSSLRLNGDNPAVKSAPDLLAGLCRQVPRPRALTYTSPASPASPSKEPFHQYSDISSLESTIEKERYEEKISPDVSGIQSEGLHIDSTELFGVCIPVKS